MNFDYKKLLFPVFVAVIFIIYYKSLLSDFIEMDDALNFYQNPHFKDVDINSILFFWKHSYENIYIPVMYSVWGGFVKLSHLIFKRLDPFFFHFMNLSLHIFNSFILFTVSSCLLNQKGYGDQNKIFYASFFSMIFFAFHPVDVEAISWASSGKDTLSTFFALLSIFFFIKFISSENLKKLYLLFAILFFMMGLLSKPNIVVLPAYITAIYFAFFNRNLNIKRFGLALLPFAVLSFVFIIITRNNMFAAWIDLPLSARVFVAGDSILFYLKKIFLFLGSYHFDYGRKPDLVLADYKTYCYTFLLVLLLIVLYRRNKNMFWFFIGFSAVISPYTGIIPYEFQRLSTVSDRYMYFALTFASIFTAYFLYLKLDLKKIKIITLCVFTFFSVKSFTLTSNWLDNYTFNIKLMEFNPASASASNNLGSYYLRHGKVDLAKKYLLNSIRINYREPTAYFNLAQIYKLRGKNNISGYYIREYNNTITRMLKKGE